MKAPEPNYTIDSHGNPRPKASPAPAVAEPKTATDQINGLLEYYKGDHIALGMVRALGVVCLDPRMVQHLTENDPQTLRQCQSAIGISDLAR